MRAETEGEAERAGEENTVQMCLPIPFVCETQFSPLNFYRRRQSIGSTTARNLVDVSACKPIHSSAVSPLNPYADVIIKINCDDRATAAATFDVLLEQPFSESEEQCSRREKAQIFH